MTGHLIRVFSPDREFLFSIGESNFTLRVETKFDTIDSIGRCPIVKVTETLDLPIKYLNMISQGYDGIIVSRITAEVLRREGYKGDVYIPGNKLPYIHKNGVKGCTNLHKFEMDN